MDQERDFGARHFADRRNLEALTSLSLRKKNAGATWKPRPFFNDLELNELVRVLRLSSKQARKAYDNHAGSSQPKQLASEFPATGFAVVALP